MKLLSNSEIHKQNKNWNSGCTFILQTSRRTTNKLPQTKSSWLPCSGINRRLARQLLGTEDSNLAINWVILQKLGRAVWNKQRGMLSSGVVLLHENTWSHTAGLMQWLIEPFKWYIFDHPPYNQYLVPSDFHLFLHMKKALGRQCFKSKWELQPAWQIE